MNSIILKAVFFVIISVSLLACEKADDGSLDKSLKTLMDFKSKQLFNETGGINNFMSVISASQFNSKNLNLAGYSPNEDYINGTCEECDSTKMWSYFTCAQVTETNNADGSTTTVYDYGTGCDEYGSLMKGKITYIWKVVGNNYDSKVVYDHFYCSGMELNGFSENSFTSNGESNFEYSNAGTAGGDSVDTPEISFNWSGSSFSKENFTLNYDNGEKYIYSSEYSTKWENSTYTVVSGEYNYISESEDFDYSYVVNKPIVTNYECSLSWIPVSGKETTISKKSGKTDELIIDYGDGTCDIYAFVTENGKTTKVDMSKWYTVSSEGEAVTNSNKSKVKFKVRKQ